MDCKSLLDRLDAYLDEALASPECVDVEAHTAACAPCRALVAHCRQLIRSYRRQPPAPLPAGVHQRVMEGIASRMKPLGPRRNPNS